MIKHKLIKNEHVILIFIIFTLSPTLGTANNTVPKTDTYYTTDWDSSGGHYSSASLACAAAMAGRSACGASCSYSWISSLTSCTPNSSIWPIYGILVETNGSSANRHFAYGYTFVGTCPANSTVNVHGSCTCNAGYEAISGQCLLVSAPVAENNFGPGCNSAN